MMVVLRLLICDFVAACGPAAGWGIHPMGAR
jgi:hypothetical protein